MARQASTSRTRRARGVPPEEVTEARATARFLRISPRKARPVVDLVRGKPVGEAATILRFTRRKAAGLVEKVLASAVANATNNHGMDPRRLYVHAIWVDGGPILTRIRPGSRWQAFTMLKRTSHISVVLREFED
ncbi:MAG: 50S ribosomal protein L22 [Firmicutes bacterium]|nr:50S ribosomal protein L22 [Bacillota bacterium]